MVHALVQLLHARAGTRRYSDTSSSQLVFVSERHTMLQNQIDGASYIYMCDCGVSFVLFVFL